MADLDGFFAKKDKKKRSKNKKTKDKDRDAGDNSGADQSKQKQMAIGIGQSEVRTCFDVGVASSNHTHLLSSCCLTHVMHTAGV